MDIIAPRMGQLLVAAALCLFSANIIYTEWWRGKAGDGRGRWGSTGSVAPHKHFM